MLKRCFDLFVATIGLILLSPALLVLMLVIRCRLGSPVLFYQRRAGWYEKPFMLYKFRSMLDKVDEQGAPLPDAERVTPFGQWLRRYSLDELPQLLNVIKGDISLVGPRPLLIEYLPHYDERQRQRHSVKPGITGWAQINGRNAISWQKKFELDLWYVENKSFMLDMKILWVTCARVIKAEDINQPGHVTYERFTGTRNQNTEDKEKHKEH